jgi:alpha-galactosidase
VTNLPQAACVEVPVWVSRKGFEAVHVGALPPQCAALTSLTSQIEEMAVEGALIGDARLIFQAIAFDPLTSAVLSLAEIEQMVNQMFEQNKDYLPNFKSLKV